MDGLLPVVWGSKATIYLSSSPVFTEPKPSFIFSLLNGKTLVNTCINFDRHMCSQVGGGWWVVCVQVVLW